MTNEQIDRKIVEASCKGKLIIFAGAGVTRYLNIPIWIDFAIKCFKLLSKDEPKYEPYIEILENIKKGNRDNPQDILDTIKDKYDKLRVKMYVYEHFKVSSEEDCWYHKKLLQLTGKIITTNFDDAFEIAYRQLNQGKPPFVLISEIQQSLYKRIRSESDFIFKIHGCASSPDHCAIFSRDLEKIYNDIWATQISLESFMSDNVILFIGYSFQDKEVINIFNKLFDALPSTERNWFVLTNEPESYSKHEYLVPRTIVFENDCIKSYLDDLLYKKHVKSGFIEEIELSETLHETMLFSGIDTLSVLTNIVKGATVKSLKNGEKLCKKDEKVDSFWYIISGKIMAVNNCVTRSALLPIGEIGFLHNWHLQESKKHLRSSDLIAVEDGTKVLEIKQEQINKLEHKDQMTFWTNFAKVLANKLNENAY